MEGESNVLQDCIMTDSIYALKKIKLKNIKLSENYHYIIGPV